MRGGGGRLGTGSNGWILGLEVVIWRGKVELVGACFGNGQEINNSNWD